MKKFKPLTETLLILSFLSVLSAVAAYLIQSQANRSVSSCSYLDPITVDIAALAIALFFILEGLIDIFKHSGSMVKNQISRCIRVCLGVSILTIHIMQFIHK